ncbi:AMP-binding protein [Streptomyces sp. AB3(2024)]|uniref:AMP-binding protein n=1 Tax=Streptomyces sp. AB3(2024) TaxID=3317321 RepID=UPI0035A274A7
MSAPRRAGPRRTEPGPRSSSTATGRPGTGAATRWTTCCATGPCGTDRAPRSCTATPASRTRTSPDDEIRLVDADGEIRLVDADGEIRLVDADGEDVPDGEPGELLVRGPCTVRGYYRAPDENARAFTADGRFRTGARARRTPDANVVVTGPDREEPAGDTGPRPSECPASSTPPGWSRWRSTPSSRRPVLPMGPSLPDAARPLRPVRRRGCGRWT